MRGKTKPRAAIFFYSKLDLPLIHFKRKDKKGLDTSVGQPSTHLSATNFSPPKRDNQGSPIMANNGDGALRTLEDYSLPRPRGNTASIVRPPIQANNFEVKPILLQLVQQDEFMGLPSKAPNDHIQNSILAYDMIKINGVSDEAIKSPHNEIPEWLQIRTFCDVLNVSTRATIDATTGGVIRKKTPE
ncbi:hypothetical protein SESBI_49655 [Sesbania bispinosa]|nr:hypothetical protein SESBI_49655 [Sesbania bispinosa]